MKIQLLLAALGLTAESHFKEIPGVVAAYGRISAESAATESSASFVTTG